jgi:hypothetical protein
MPISALRSLPEGRYVAFGNYAYSESASQRVPLESFFSLSRARTALKLEGYLARRAGRQGFTVEVELPLEQPGKGYFVAGSGRIEELKGVIGLAGERALVLAGRSKDPPAQLAMHITMLEERELFLQGLLAYEDYRWLTWSLSMKPYEALARAARRH